MNGGANAAQPQSENETMQLVISIPHNNKWFDIYRINDGRYIVKLEGDHVIGPLVTRTECVELIRQR
jgi:hypothetical protein